MELKSIIAASLMDYNEINKMVTGFSPASATSVSNSCSRPQALYAVWNLDAVPHRYQTQL